MEDWQRRVIKTNLPKLIKDTICSTLLVAILLAKELLSEEEWMQINVISSPMEKAAFLYAKIITRTNAYEEFLKACREDKQSGVVCILENGEQEHFLSVGLRECSISELSCQIRDNINLSNFDDVSNAISKYVQLNAFKAAFEGHSGQADNKLWLLRGPDNETFLHVAAAYGYMDLVNYLIELGLCITLTDSKGRTPGHYIGKFSTNIIVTSKVLIQHGLNIRQVDNTGLTIASTVVLHGRINQYHYHHWVEYMIKNGYGDVFVQKCKHGGTCLHHGLKMLDIDKETLDLLSKSANISTNQPDNMGCTPLHWALMFRRSWKTIKNLLEVGRDCEQMDKQVENLLQFAMQGSNMEVLSFLISPESENKDVCALKETPLYKMRFRKSQNYLQMTKHFLDIGVDLYVKNKNGHNIAHFLSFAKNISADDFTNWANFMIDNGHSNIFAAKDFVGNTPLQASMEKLDLELSTLKLILESSRVDINQANHNGCTLLHLALDFQRSFQTIKNLVDLGANINAKDNQGSGVLHWAVHAGNEEAIQHLISLGLDVNETDNDGFTPLHRVRETKSKKYFDITKLLLDKGADLYSKNEDGNTLAHEMVGSKEVSCEDFRIWVAAMIKSSHAPLVAIRGGKYGRNLLHTSMERVDLDWETIKLMVESANLDINQRDDEGNTTLHVAVGFGRDLGTIKNLINLGADWKMKGQFGCNVMHFSVMGNNEEAFLYFKSIGADVNGRDENGKTPLHCVCFTSGDYLDMTKFLLENGVKLKTQSYDGTMLDHLMLSENDISDEEYSRWKEGMIQLGHASIFRQKSSQTSSGKDKF